MESIKTNGMLGEKLIINQLPSGLKCYIISRKGYVEKQAMVCVKYGSMDNAFAVDGVRRDMPAGIAHFLEHKLFEESGGGNVFNRFIPLGGDCNAFTNFTTTAYYFSCTEHFNENLKLLLSFTQEPYFTEESVSKEKAVIAQEITMYADDPHWAVYFNLLRALYSVSPVRGEIAGTAASVQEITRDMLYDCYNAFYELSNMALIVAGDVDAAEIFETAERTVKQKQRHFLQRLYGDEPKQVNQAFAEQSMGVALPLFYIGFKDNHYAAAPEKRIAATKVLLDIAVGESSAFYARLYDEGLIDDNFDMNYMNSLYFGATIVGGYSKSPERVQDALLREIDRLKKDGIDDSTFERIKKKHIGRFIKGFNDLNAIVCSRLNLKMEAVTSLEKACRLNTSMIYRCIRDAEIKKLIADYNLQERLDEIEMTSMN